MPLKRDIDRIIDLLIADIPFVQINQLVVVPSGADDDGLWFVRVPGQKEEVQLESSYGCCPFLIESDFNDERFDAHSPNEVVARVKDLYGLA